MPELQRSEKELLRLLLEAANPCETKASNDLPLVDELEAFKERLLGELAA